MGEATADRTCRSCTNAKSAAQRVERSGVSGVIAGHVSGPGWRKNEVRQPDAGRDPEHLRGVCARRQNHRPPGRAGAWWSAPRTVVTQSVPAWWQAIDLDGNGEISQIEFIKALRKDAQLGINPA